MMKFSNCPACLATNTRLLDYRESVPILQNKTLPTVDEAKAFPSGKLSMLQCIDCGFVWNEAFDQSIINYDCNYDNSVAESEYYIEHLRQMADRLLTSIPPDRPIHYVEIGCGQGDFLTLVVERSKGRVLTATGFDPSYRSSNSLPNVAQIHSCIFDQSCLDRISENTNIICSRHTIEHISDVRTFAESLKAPMFKDDRKLFIETPDADWILKNVAVQDFFYEHCSLFNPRSISQLFTQSGLSCKTSLVYDEQYLWLEAYSSAPEKLDSYIQQDDADLGEYFIQNRSKFMSHWSDYLVKKSRLGPIAIWGAASKGVTFSLLLLGQPNVQIDYAIDLNKSKQKRFLPTTAIRIISPNEAFKLGVKTIIIMNPNYEAEIIEFTQKLDWKAEISVLGNEHYE